LLLALQMQDTQGDQDLYVSFRVGNNRWSKPKNIGKTVNTAKVEFAPFLGFRRQDPLFFFQRACRIRGSRYFLHKRLDDTWLNWSGTREHRRSGKH
jgi:OmpA-OmpF porin, OOP family